MNPLNIGYCTFTDPEDQHAWSGTHHFIMKALQKKCGNVIPLGPIGNKYLLSGKIINRLSRMILKKQYDFWHSPYICREYAKKLQNKILNENIDILFMPAGSQLLAFLSTSLPVIYLSDATFASLENYHQDYSNLLNISSKNGNLIEHLSIKKAVKIIYSSEWAAKSAIEYYGCDPDKISIIPFGANLKNVPSTEFIFDSRKTVNEKLKLLFIGVNWERKGGNIAFETMCELNRRGIDTELIICGSQPPENIIHEKIRVYGFINKNDPEQGRLLEKLYLDASFLIFPTRNEAAGIVSCEASAFGLPVIATATGGVPTYVRNNVNGYLIEHRCGYREYADAIENIWLNKTKYMELCLRSREVYDSDYNWDKWAEKTNYLLQQCCNK